MRCARRALAAVGFAWTAVTLFAAGGCEALVGDSLGPVIMCVDLPEACPPGQQCVDGVCKVASCSGRDCEPHDAARDTMVQDHDATPPDDTSTDALPAEEASDAPEASGPLPNGAKCSSDEACASGMCLSGDVFGTGVTLPFTTVCGAICCNSSECNAAVPGMLCFPSGSGGGGNYCVKPSWTKLTATGKGVAGQTCTGGGDCLSGECDTAKSVCEDTCCTDTDCAMGSTVCQPGTLGTLPTFECLPAVGSLAAGSSCGSSKSCANDFCLAQTGYCIAGCCGTSDCKTQGGDDTVCLWTDIELMDKSEVELRTCQVPPKGAAYQAACSGNAACSSGVCDKSGACTQPCCTNSDCGSTWVCSHEEFSLTKIGSIDLQVCVPPASTDQ